MKKIIKSMALAFFAIVLNGAVMAAERGTADEATALVRKAASYVKDNGKDKAFAAFNDAKGGFVDRDLYIFAYSTNGDGIVLAHGANAKMRGKNLLEIKDSDGKFIVKKFLEVANSGSGKGWVDYKWANPTTNAIETKSTYVERVGDIFLACGVFK